MNRPIATLSSPARAGRACRLLAATFAGALTTAAAVGADVTPFDYHASAATLTYTVQIDGEADSGDPRQGEWSRSEEHLHLRGTLHLRGQQETFAAVDNPREQIARAEGARQAMAGQMPAMQKIAEECGDDDDCASARMMALVHGLSPDKRQALAATARGPAARLSQHAHAGWALDGTTACSLQARSEGDTHTRSISDTEGRGGYQEGSETRHGRAGNDCLSDPYPDASAEWHGDDQRLDITLPGLTLTEQWQRSGGDTGSRRVRIPDVELPHQHWSGKGPQSGQEKRHVQIEAGGRTVPATMTIRWTFAPAKA